DHDFIKMIKNYLAKVYKREEKFIQENIADLKSNSNKENISSYVQLKNLLKVATKGRPKLVSHHKDNINQHLTHNNSKQKRPNLCSYCKESGHNIATCSKKLIDQN
ncbi:25642_t:CDS:1, partial [Racocetra persica]